MGPLTKREEEVLRLAALGYRTSFIARKLVIKNPSVSRHLLNVARKLGVAAHPYIDGKAYSISWYHLMRQAKELRIVSI